jgi:hypothetical protein
MSTLEKDVLTSLEKDWNDEIEGSLKNALTGFSETYKEMV